MPPISFLALAGCPTPAGAHAAEQGFVLLLPTDLYTAAGVAAVVVTVLLLALLPGGTVARLCRAVPLTRLSLRGIREITSLLSFVLLAGLVWAGLDGPRDPLANPLPLAIWTLFWIALVTVQALAGNVWAYLTPWAGPLALTRRVFAPWDWARYPATLGHGLGVVSFLGFAFVLLADPAPADPDRLARYVAVYWLFNFVMALIYGPRWLRRAEGLGLAMRLFARLSVFARHRGRLAAGLPGWQVLVRRPLPGGMAVLAVLLLGTGSFDGLNETFWWLARLEINPLEFPGRSAVVWQNALGLLAANAALVAVLWATTRLGTRLAGAALPPGRAFCLFAPTLLPIALGYHVAHYLPSFLVDGQYALVALSDPFLTGADWLGLGEHFVTTGFFNTRASVRVIYLAQAGAIVLGHILAVALAHGLAVRVYGTGPRAALSQAPLAAFMVAYTLFGLWLLASPRF